MCHFVAYAACFGNILDTKFKQSGFGRKNIEMKFKPLPAVKIPIAFLFMFSLGVSVFFGYMTFQFRELSFSFYTFIPGVLFMMFVACTVWVGLIFYMLSRLELVFNSTTLEMKSAPWIKRFMLLFISRLQLTTNPSLKLSIHRL
jgi:hypothetical protein